MVRKATLDDAEMLARTGLGVLADLPNYAGVEYRPEHTLQMINTYLTLPNLACFFEEKDGEVIGLFMGIVAPQWFTPTLEMSEIMFWVRADHRGTGIALELMRVMEEWAIGLGAKKLIMAAGSGYQTEKVVKFYNRRGYKTWAVSCCKEI